MDVISDTHRTSSPYTVLVTGANSGLGFSICCRLLDQFLERNLPHLHSTHLVLVLTTRSAKKGQDTIDRLQSYLAEKSRKEEVKFPGLSQQWSRLVKFRHEALDLNSIVSIQQLARRLHNEKSEDRIYHLDAIICNAGIGGWTGINWPLAVYEILTNLKEAVTYPVFKISGVGVVTKPQVQSAKEVPAVGEVFCANIFGHYLLAHYLNPLLDARSARHNGKPGRVIWVSTLEAHADTFSLTDLQGLKTRVPYESSKRLTDLLALTATLPSTSPYTTTFFTPSPIVADNELSKNGASSDATAIPAASRPRHYLSHPGICGTNIIALHQILITLMLWAFYGARWIGSPWHTIEPYLGATAPVWLALASPETLAEEESRAGQGKWGSSTNWWGKERVLRTFIEGWGWGGKEGEQVIMGRKRALGDVKKGEREKFEEAGRECWRAMEELRQGWEERIANETS